MICCILDDRLVSDGSRKYVCGCRKHLWVSQNRSLKSAFIQRSENTLEALRFSEARLRGNFESKGENVGGGPAGPSAFFQSIVLEWIPMDQGDPDSTNLPVFRDRENRC